MNLNPVSWVSEEVIQFTESALPFLFKSRVCWRLWDNWMEVYENNGRDNPLIAAVSGHDHTQPIKVTRNDRLLPHELLQALFHMCRNRAIIEWQRKRGVPSDEQWQWFLEDRYRALALLYDGKEYPADIAIGAIGELSRLLGRYNASKIIVSPKGAPGHGGSQLPVVVQCDSEGWRSVGVLTSAGYRGNFNWYNGGGGIHDLHPTPEGLAGVGSTDGESHAIQWMKDLRQG
jgi:hypothetical protein